MSVTEMRPDFSGVWELILEKSILRGPAPKRLLVRIKHREPELTQQLLITYADDRQVRMTFVFQTDALRGNTIGGATLRTRAWWEGPELVFESTMESSVRMAHYKDHWSLSTDGRTLTMEHRDDDLAGQISVLEKCSADAAQFEEQ